MVRTVERDVAEAPDAVGLARDVRDARRRAPREIQRCARSQTREAHEVAERASRVDPCDRHRSAQAALQHVHHVRPLGTEPLDRLAPAFLARLRSQRYRKRAEVLHRPLMVSRRGGIRGAHLLPHRREHAQAPVLEVGDPHLRENARRRRSHRRSLEQLRHVLDRRALREQREHCGEPPRLRRHARRLEREIDAHRPARVLVAPPSIERRRPPSPPLQPQVRERVALRRVREKRDRQRHPAERRHQLRHPGALPRVLPRELAEQVHVVRRLERRELDRLPPNPRGSQRAPHRSEHRHVRRLGQHFEGRFGAVGIRCVRRLQVVQHDERRPLREPRVQRRLRPWSRRNARRARDCRLHGVPRRRAVEPREHPPRPELPRDLRAPHDGDRERRLADPGSTQKQHRLHRRRDKRPRHLVSERVAPHEMRNARQRRRQRARLPRAPIRHEIAHGLRDAHPREVLIRPRRDRLPVLRQRSEPPERRLVHEARPHEHGHDRRPLGVPPAQGRGHLARPCIRRQVVRAQQHEHHIRRAEVLQDRGRRVLPRRHLPRAPWRDLLRVPQWRELPLERVQRGLVRRDVRDHHGRRRSRHTGRHYPRPPAPARSWLRGRPADPPSSTTAAPRSGVATETR